ncbi:MAG: hypothetical protein CMC88_04695 [Flavobacteriaceae bacterium]|nr:hypothetical protein [Flavobacteriaceae bacterium]|tara:strand:- start:21140 stop:21376 length:237 start_codon:yes stop_codon:yes gene_type:complete
MKQLNENWFGITLLAVVFGLLGFLLGKQQITLQLNEGKMKMKQMGGKMIENQMMMLDQDSSVEVDIDTIDDKDKLKSG